MNGQAHGRSGRRRPGAALEALERRQLMTLPPGSYDYYHVSIPTHVVLPQSAPPPSFVHPVGTPDRILSQLDNRGKVLTGKDRQGDEWQLTLHGPGELIVTDATPNDGVYNDDLATIQIVGSDLHSTIVTGQVTSSARIFTDGNVVFNRLIALDGVQQIVLNGFNLGRTVDPAVDVLNNAGPEIFLPQGVQLLQFHNIIAPINIASDDQPIEIVIGEQNTPLEVRPTIKIDSIFNTVFDSALATNPNGIPVTVPTVQIIVNGEIHGLEILSATAQPIELAGLQYAFPTVGTTGRTAVRALGIQNLLVNGTARNFTASRQPIPFNTDFSGMEYLGAATFGGTADAVGLDVSGPIGRLRFVEGLGNPAGSLPGGANLGVPDFARGYPSFGLLGGLIKASRIGSIEAAPANLTFETNKDPDFIQNQRTGSTTYFARPGNALTSVGVTSQYGIDRANLVGILQNSEIATGFDYNSYSAGLDGMRIPSRINAYHQRGALIDSVIAATYRPKNFTYGDINAEGKTDDEAGPGVIRGRFQGLLADTQNQTALGNYGVGFFARDKFGYLPPPARPRRIHGVFV